MAALSLSPHALYEEVAELLRQRIFNRELVKFLKAHPEIWVGTFQQVLDYVAAHTR